MARLRDLLSDDERVRHDRLRVPAARDAFLLGRALVRITLSRYAGRPAAAWRFRTNAFGRPEIAETHDPGLRFSTSHTRGLVAVLVSLGREVGLDVEDATQDASRLVAAAREIFSPAEAAALAALPAPRRSALFFRYWTLKEAYAKARGEGLLLPLDRFGFVLEDGAPPRLSGGPGSTEDPDTWQFAQMHVGPFLLAAAVRRVPGTEVRIQLHQAVVAT